VKSIPTIAAIIFIASMLTASSFASAQQQPMISPIALRFTFLRSGTGRTIPMDWFSIMASIICFPVQPFGDTWGHMSWGHAVSRDLLHWHQLPLAIPEQNGVMIFTGSVVIDRTDSSGLCKPARSALLRSIPAMEIRLMAIGRRRILPTAWTMAEIGRSTRRTLCSICTLRTSAIRALAGTRNATTGSWQSLFRESTKSVSICRRISSNGRTRAILAQQAIPTVYGVP